MDKITNIFEVIKKTGKKPGEFTDEELSSFEYDIQDDFTEYINKNLPKIYIKPEDREMGGKFEDDFYEDMAWVFTSESHREYEKLQDKLIAEFKKLTGEEPIETYFDGGVVND